MEKLRILYLIPSLTNSGGMERVLTEKVNFLSDKEIKVSIFTTDMKDTEIPFYPLSDLVKVHNAKIFLNSAFSLPLLSKIKKTKELLSIYQIQLEQFIIEHQIDICISMGAKELEFFSKLSVPVIKVFESHFNPNVRSSFISDHKGKSLLWNWIGKYRDWQYRQQTKNLDQIVVLTKAAKIEWEKTHSNVCLIHNPIPFDIEKTARSQIFNRVIAIGRLEDQKGFDLLIQSWKRVSNKHLGWQLDIYGEGSKKEQLFDLINKNNLEKTIKLKGVSKQIKKELLNSDFYVMSSRYEGLPMVLLESIACGLPIVSFDCPTGPAEIIENNDCGLLALNGDIVDLTDKIMLMIENPELRFEKSQVALNKAKLYSLDRIMSQWEGLFRTLKSR